jgi:hypothetical protein
MPQRQKTKYLITSLPVLFFFQRSIHRTQRKNTIVIQARISLLFEYGVNSQSRLETRLSDSSLLITLQADAKVSL